MILLALLLACAAPAPEAAPEAARVSAAPLLEHLSWTSGGQGDEVPLPTVIALHGLGDAPEGFRFFLQGYEGDVRVIAPRAPLPWPKGTSWLTYGAMQPGGPVADELRGRADEVVALIDALTAGGTVVGRPVVAGFSQGGMLSYAVAVLHPEAVAGAVPVGGYLPRGLTPSHASPAQAAVPIRAVHGSADEVVPYRWAAGAAEALAAAGFDVTLDTIPGAGHAVPPPARERVHHHVRDLLVPEAAP